MLALALAACLLPQPSYRGRFQLGRARADGIERRNNGRQRETRKFHTVKFTLYVVRLIGTLTAHTGADHCTVS